MIRTSIIFLLMAVTLLANSGKAIILMDYWVNYDYYATVLCENKDKPMLNCNGKCYLKKSFQQQEKNASNSPFKTDKIQEVVWNVCCVDDLPSVAYNITDLGSSFISFKEQTHTKDLLRPPRWV